MSRPQNLPSASATPALTPSGADFNEKIKDSAPEYSSPNLTDQPDKDVETLKEAGSPPPRTPLGNIDSHPEVVSHKEEPDRPRKRRRLMLWVIIGLVGFLVLAIALGVGLGVGLTRHNNSNSSSRCGSFRAGNWNHCLLYQVLLQQHQVLHRIRHCLMEYSTILR